MNQIIFLISQYLVMSISGFHHKLDPLLSINLFENNYTSKIIFFFGQNKIFLSQCVVYNFKHIEAL